MSGLLLEKKKGKTEIYSLYYVRFILVNLIACENGKVLREKIMFCSRERMERLNLWNGKVNEARFLNRSNQKAEQRLILIRCFVGRI